jgi:putative pyruvate formate lyase activating enzyme
MYRQVGAQLVLGDDGIARRGMIIRHLILPDGLAGTADVLRWIAGHLSQKVHVSLMAQYFPAYQCVKDGVLGSKITDSEYDAAIAALDSTGLENGWVQALRVDEGDGREWD